MRVCLIVVGMEVFVVDVNGSDMMSKITSLRCLCGMSLRFGLLLLLLLPLLLHLDLLLLLLLFLLLLRCHTKKKPLFVCGPQSIWQVGVCYSRGMGCVGDADTGLEYKKKALAMGYIEWDEKKKPGH
jgi:hypothetical protein